MYSFLDFYKKHIKDQYQTYIFLFNNYWNDKFSEL